MDLLDSLRALLRRWPLTLALLAVTVAATGGALMAIPWQYEAKSTVVFLSSRKGAQPVGGNPWLAFDGSLTITAEVIARGMSDERTLQQLAAQGNTADFTVGLAQDSRGPLLDITATGADPAVAQATMQALTTMSRQRLAELQKKSGILPDATIRAEVVTAGDKALRTPEKKIRLLVVVFAAGMLLTVGVPLFVESLAHKRRRITAAQSGFPPAPPPPQAQTAFAAVSAEATPTPAPTYAVTPAAAPAAAPTPATTSATRPGPAPDARPEGAGPASTRPGGGEDEAASTRPGVRRDEPADPWDEPGDESYTAPMRAIRADDEIYVWPSGSERASRAVRRDGGGEPGAAGERSTSGGEADGESYAVFDPTTPGR